MDRFDVSTDLSGDAVNSVLLVTNAPTPYRIPLFNELNRLIGNNGFEFRVAFATKGYEHRRWEVDLDECKFDYVILDSRSFRLNGSAERTVFTYDGIGKAIRSFSPSVLIVPGFSVASARVCLASRLWHIPYLIWSGTIQRFGTKTPTWRTWQRTLVAHGASGAVAYGSKARSYLIDLGLLPEKVFLGINTVDTEYYRLGCLVRRKHLGLSYPRSLLFVGHLTPGKRIDLLLLALAYLAKKRTDFVLRIVGSGPEEARLRAMVSSLGISEFVTFEGFHQKSEVLDYLAHASCFLFPSEYDIWGLVLNEAMAAGVPCVASIHAGATADLISDGETGFAVDFLDSKKVSALVEWVLDNPNEARRIGETASSFVSEHATIQQSAAGFMRAISGVFNVQAKET